MIQEIEVKHALNRLRSRYLPYNWDLNIYRGCSHHCQYCYALYSHRYLDNYNFFDNIYVKTNIVDALEKQLSSSHWQRETVNLGGVTDSYQPLEAKYQLMPQILKLMVKYRTPITISTKSDLILRDIDLFQELAKVATVNVAVTITTFDENLRQKLEPNSVSGRRRLDVLLALKDKNIGLGLHFMPILPFLTDTEKNISLVFSQASSIPVDYLVCGFLNLRSATKINYFQFIEKEFPDLYTRYRQIFTGAFVEKKYRDGVYKIIGKLQQQYHLNRNYQKFISKTSPKQLSLL